MNNNHIQKDGNYIVKIKVCSGSSGGCNSKIDRKYCEVHNLTQKESECKNCGATEQNWPKHCEECGDGNLCYQCVDDHVCKTNSTPKSELESVPEAARAAFICRHEFKKFDVLDTTDISVYCFKCGTTVEGNKIIPPVAYSKSESGLVDWETVFYLHMGRMFGLNNIQGGGLLEPSYRFLKSFISKLLEAQRKELDEARKAVVQAELMNFNEELREKCEGMKKGFSKTDMIGRPIPKENEREVSMYINGHNQAIDEVIKLLSDE